MSLHLCTPDCVYGGSDSTDWSRSLDHFRVSPPPNSEIAEGDSYVAINRLAEVHISDRIQNRRTETSPPSLTGPRHGVYCPARHLCCGLGESGACLHAMFFPGFCFQGIVSGIQPPFSSCMAPAVRSERRRSLWSESACESRLSSFSRP